MSTEEEIAAALADDGVWPKVLTLTTPITFGTDPITSLSFRRGKMGDLKGLTPGVVPPVEDILMLASRMCGKPAAALALLEDEDGSKVVEIAMRFFARSLGAGRKP